MNIFDVTVTVAEIAVNDRRQPPHEADVGLHAERQRMVNLFDVTAAVAEIAVNDRRQPPHKADVQGLQALHVKPLPPANCFVTTDIVTEMAADLPVEIAAHDHM